MSAAVTFDVVCVPIGEYRDPAHPTLPADKEAEQVAALLDEFGGSAEPWLLPQRERHRTNVDARLDVWSGVTRARSSVMFWVGHGSSDGDDAHLATYDSGVDAGVAPEDLARRIRAEWGYRNSDEGAWAVVVIEACGAKRFVERVNAVLHDKPNVPGRLGLIGASSDGAGHIGDFRTALEGALRSYDLNDEQIRIEDLVSRIRGRLHEGTVRDLDLHQAKPIPRRRLIEATVTAPLDVRVELTQFLTGLPPDERAHFIPKAQGAEQGELAWYFVGRATERARITSWLRTSTAGMLIVTGLAGSGKSALLGNLLVHTNPALRALLTKAQLLEPVPDDERPPDQVFDAVVHLSGMTTGDLVRTLTTTAGLPEPPASAESAHALEALLTGIDTRPFCVLVDALDEAQDPASIASSVLRRLAALPHGRVVIGTRKSTKEGPDQPDTEDEDLLDALGRAPSTVTVEVDRDPQAIATYLRRRLHAVSLDEATVDRVVDLAGAQPRQFLFARLAVHEITAQPSLVEPAHAAELARLLGNDHRDLFATAVGRLTTANPVYFGLLEALAFAQGRGLPRADRIWATAASALLDDTPVSETDIDDLLRDAAPYVMLDAEDGQSVYRLAHQTFKEHFFPFSPHFKPGLLGLPRTSRARKLAAAGRHQRIARALIAAAEPALPATPNPYLVHHLSAHIAGSDIWPDLKFTDLLDHLDPVTVARDAFRAIAGSTAFRPPELPPEITAILSANHLLAPLAPADRSGTRQVVAGRHGSTRPRGSTTASWSVRWSRQSHDPPHIVLSGHKSAVVRASPVSIADGRTILATGDTNGVVLLWDPTTATRVGPPITHPGTVTALVAVPKVDGQTVLAVGTGHGVWLWDPTTGAPAGPPVPGDFEHEKVLAAVPIPDGRTALAIADRTNHTVRFWDSETRSELHALATDHKRGIQMLVPVPWPDGRTLLASGGDLAPEGRDTKSFHSSVRLWDPTTGEQIAGRIVHMSELEPAVPLVQPDRPPLLAISGTAGVVLWDPLNPDSEIWDWLEDEARTLGELAAVPMESSPPLLASAQGGIWHSDSRELAGRLPGAGRVTAITALPLPNGRTLLATGNEDGTVRFWDPSANLESYAVTTEGTVTTVEAVPAASGEMTLATADDQGHVRLWAARDGAPVGAPLPNTYRIDHLAAGLRPDLLCASSGHIIELWDLRTRTMLAEWGEDYDREVTGLAAVALPDGRTRLARLGFGTLRIRELADGLRVGRALSIWPWRWPWPFANPHVVAVPVLGGRTLLATYDSYGSPVIRLWDPERVRAVRRGLRKIKLHHGENGVMCAAPVTLADGRVLLATAGKRTVRLWDTETWRPFGEPLPCHSGEYWADALAAIPHPEGGELLASGGRDGTVRIWDPQSGTLLLTAVIGKEIRQLAALDTGIVVRLETGIVVLDLNLKDTILQ